MKRRVIVCFSVLLVFFSGCYDNNEIDSLANVTAVGIEEEGFTFAIADTGSFSGEGEKGSESRTICCFSESDNIENAIDDVNRKISKKLSFSHLSAIIVSEGAAKRGIFDTVNYFEGMPDVRPQTLIAVSVIKPSRYLEELKSSFEVNTEKYFLNLFQKDAAYIPVLKMSEYTNSVSCGNDVLVPLISSSNDEESTVIKSALLLRKGKLLDKIEDTASLGLLNSTKNISFEYNGEKYVLNSVKKPDISIELKKGNPHVNITLYLSDKSRKFSDEKYVENKIKSHLEKMSDRGFDTFDFSKILKKSFLLQKIYESFDWKSAIKNCTYTVDVKISDGK